MVRLIERKNCMKLPYKDIFVGTESELITNPFSGESVMLVPEAVAVYDTIKGCELFGDYAGVRKGLDWFIENFPKEYFILLD
jgi:hypothetical protein